MDGLTNAEEEIIGTNPLDPDTDGDGFNDGQEVTGMSNPLNPCDPDNSQCISCVTINTGVWLEGPYENGSMYPKLNDLGYLPGQKPVTFFGKETLAGQPYNQIPWNYSGTEGLNMDYTTLGIDKANYPATVVDWVLVSLRTSTARASTVCTRAGLLHADGHIEFLVGSDCCDFRH